MRYILYVLLIGSLWACQRKTVTPPRTESALQFDFVDIDGTVESVHSDRLAFAELQTYPNLVYPVNPGADVVNLHYTVSFALPGAPDGTSRYVQLQLQRAAAPSELLQPSADSSVYVFADPQDWVDELFSEAILMQENSHTVAVEKDGISLVSFGRNEQTGDTFQLTSATVNQVPSGAIWLAVSGTFDLALDRWYPLPDEGLRGARNGTFHFVVNLADYYGH